MSEFNTVQSAQTLQNQIYGTRQSAFFSEVFTNSGHFFIFKSLSDIVSMGWLYFISDPTEYLLLAAMLIQAWYLSRPNSHRFWGNLIGFALYTMIDLPLDQLEFFENINHLVFALFSVGIATLQALRYHIYPQGTNGILIVENLARTLMVFAFFISVKIDNQDYSNYWQQLINFPTVHHESFLFLGMVFLGLLLGLKSLQVNQQKKQLQNTAVILKDLAEWGMGSHVVNTAISNPEQLNFQRCDRTILFMDIRGFTSWCEQTNPDLVAQVLNDYYVHIEPIAGKFNPLRITFTADEIMAIYPHPLQGVKAAIEMQKAASELLKSYDIGTGCAIHCGNVIEGLFGGSGVKTYTVIGDVVNTAKRLEGATPAGEITVSDSIYQRLSNQLEAVKKDPIYAKGKNTPLTAWKLIKLW